MSFHVFHDTVHDSMLSQVSLLVLRFCVCPSGFWTGEITRCLRCDAMPRLGVLHCPAFSHCIEGLGPHLLVCGLALRAVTHETRAALSFMCRFESDLVSLVYSVEVGFGSQLAKGSMICEFGLLGLSFVEGKQAAKSSEGKFFTSILVQLPFSGDARYPWDPGGSCKHSRCA